MTCIHYWPWRTEGYMPHPHVRTCPRALSPCTRWLDRVLDRHDRQGGDGDGHGWNIGNQRPLPLVRYVRTPPRRAWPRLPHAAVYNIHCSLAYVHTRPSELASSTTPCRTRAHKLNRRQCCCLLSLVRPGNHACIFSLDADGSRAGSLWIGSHCVVGWIARWTRCSARCTAAPHPLVRFRRRPWLPPTSYIFFLVSVVAVHAQRQRDISTRRRSVVYLRCVQRWEMSSLGYASLSNDFSWEKKKGDTHNIVSIRGTKLQLKRRGKGI